MYFSFLWQDENTYNYPAQGVSLCFSHVLVCHWVCQFEVLLFKIKIKRRHRSHNRNWKNGLQRAFSNSLNIECKNADIQDAFERSADLTAARRGVVCVYSGRQEETAAIQAESRSFLIPNPGRGSLNQAPHRLMNSSLKQYVHSDSYRYM